MLYCATISNTLFHHTNRVVKPSEKNNGQSSSYCRMIPPEWQDDRREMRWQPPSPCFVMLAEQQESQGEMGWQLGARCVSDSLTLVNAMCQHGMRDAGGNKPGTGFTSLHLLWIWNKHFPIRYKKMRPPTKQLQGSCDGVAAYCSFVLITLSICYSTIPL